jgi:hypothetical protein
MQTRSGHMVSPQFGKMGNITDLSTSNFKLADGNCFNIKNEGIDSVILEVKLAGGDEFIETKFEPGWNPEIIKEIKYKAAAADYSLKYGY